MASNFHMFSYETRDSLHLKLEGDFDGTSAYELLETLKKNGNGFYQIFIDTNDLKTIYPFGREVFQKKLGTFKQQSSHLIFIGENGRKISPD
jgi:anti-anti-sigma regulatory factor